MEKTFKYQFTTGCYYLEDSDEMEYSYEDFEYSPLEDDLKDAIVEELFYLYFDKKERELFDTTNQRVAIKKALRKFTDDNDNWEELANDFESELKEYFRDEAYEEYKNRGC